MSNEADKKKTVERGSTHSMYICNVCVKVLQMLLNTFVFPLDLKQKTRTVPVSGLCRNFHVFAMFCKRHFYVTIFFTTTVDYKNQILKGKQSK